MMTEKEQIELIEENQLIFRSNNINEIAHSILAKHKEIETEDKHN